jgi:hypothetical protein
MGSTERKGENPLFLYCNRSVEKRVVCVEFWKWRKCGNQATGTSMSRKAEIMINPSGKKKLKEEKKKRNETKGDNITLLHD